MKTVLALIFGLVVMPLSSAGAGSNRSLEHQVQKIALKQSSLPLRNIDVQELPAQAPCRKAQMRLPNLRIGRTVLQISCPGSEYRYSIRVVAELKEPVLNRDLAKGTVIKPADVSWQWQRHFSQPRPYISDSVLGKAVARKSLKSGSTLYASQVKMPDDVRRKEVVTANINMNGITLSRPVIALSSGRVGDQIRVSHPNDNTKWKATITAPGQVSW